MVLMKSQIPYDVKPDNTKIWKRDLRESSLRSFGRWLTSFDWSEIYSTVTCEAKYEKFNSVLSEMINLLIPLKKTKVSKSDKPWMTSAIKALIIKRQKALHEYGKSYESYKFWRNSVHESIKSASGKYYGRCVEKLKASNPSKWWKEIKSLGGISSKCCWYNQILSNDIPCCRDLADVFNNFLYGLTSHFVPLSCEKDQFNVDVPNEYFVDVYQVYNELRSIKVNKCSGPDIIPNKILKEFANELAPVITDIYNASLKQGVVPTNLNALLLSP